MSDFKFTPSQLDRAIVDETHKLRRDAAEQLERKKTKILFELITAHLGYEPVVSEALTKLGHSIQADGSSLFTWDGMPIVTFNGLKPQPFNKYDAAGTEITLTVEYQSHVG